jgi:hypothetical protein
MDNIEVKVLNPEAVKNSEQMMVVAARLTQQGHKIHSLDDFMALYEKPYSAETIKNMVNLPHPTIQKFGVINIPDAIQKYAFINRKMQVIVGKYNSSDYMDYICACTYYISNIHLWS